VATLGGGLNKVIENKTNDNCSFKRYTTSNGLIDNDVETMAEDAEGNLWLGGYGLTKFNPEIENFQHFNHRDGLQSNSFKVGAVFTDKNKRLYFGGINGVNYFDPASILANTITPKVLITDVDINDGHLIYDVNTTDSGIGIQLKAIENNVSFSFIGLQFDGAEKNQYKYKLEGHDDHWTSTAFPSLSANYLNVPPGQYTFKVMASNKDGIWSPDVEEVQLRIFRPWYLTNIAFFIYLCLFISALYFYRKVTENQIRLKNELLLAEKEHELDRSKLSFFTKISHELRSPLTLIKGPLEELLLFSKIGQVTKNKLQLMQKSTDRLLKLTNQLLDFRKMETGNMKIKTRRQNFVKFANELFLLFSQSASSKNISFEFMSSSKEIPLMFDADKMEIILMNLLSNAFKYTDVGGTIKMDISTVGQFSEDAVWESGALAVNYISVKVIDDGAGMSLDEVKKVFNPYYQVKNVSVAQPIGTGLGLSLVKGLIKLHGGDIIIESNRGEGTICESRLPFGDKHLDPKQIDQSDYVDDLVLTYNNIEEKSLVNQDEPLYIDRLTSLHKKYKLLIVEDNVELNKYIKTVLSEHFVVETAFNGLEGYESALDFEPDIILSDVMMPLLDGIGLCEKIKADDQTAHIPIILLTARTSFVYELNGLTKGAEDYISKPFSVSLLITKINAILKNRELQREFYRKQLFFEPVKETHLNPDEQLVFDAIRYIEANVDSADLDVKSLSEALYQSQSNLYRKVKLVTGKSIVELIKDVRIQNAAKLLREGKWTVTQVAYKSGFNSIKYFRKCFKNQYNVNPSEFHLLEFSSQKDQLDDQIKYN
jgi:signal transduction histidine kinase/DNA-binding response OmpR family regulator